MSILDEVKRKTVSVPLVIAPEITIRLGKPRRGYDGAMSYSFVENVRRSGKSEYNPYWSSVWEGGQVFARHLLDNPDLVKGKRVLDFGTGSGVAAIAALKAGARSVTAVDMNPYAREAARLNARENKVKGLRVVEKIDPNSKWDVILGGDILYDYRAADFLIPLFERAVRRGTTVLMAVTPKRPPRESFEKIGSFSGLTNGYGRRDDDLTHTADLWIYRSSRALSSDLLPREKDSGWIKAAAIMAAWKHSGQFDHGMVGRYSEEHKVLLLTAHKVEKFTKAYRSTKKNFVEMKGDLDYTVYI